MNEDRTWLALMFGGSLIAAIVYSVGAVYEWLCR